MAKSEKPAAPASQAKGQAPGKGPQQEEAGEGVAKSKRKKLIFAVAGVLVLGIAAGAGWYFTKGKHGEETKVAAPAKFEQPKFIPLETFTVNLQPDGEGDQFLQAGITLKIDELALEEKIKQAMPEIRSRLLMLLSGKHAADLVPADGKKILAQEIIKEVNTALGVKLHALPAAVKAPAVDPCAASGVAAHSEAAAPAEPAAAEEATAEEDQKKQEKKAEESKGVLDVLFTSFIIQ
ncbi:MAG: flagellar basal body-associated protein FliL [Gallionellaceae bacterium]|nr:flagellar basal body-associated protein FliL [Gallionellaceae bacterium]